MTLRTGVFPGWKSRDSKPVLELRFLPGEIAEKFALRLVRDEDDLDRFVATHFIDEEIGPVVLRSYDHTPAKGTIVYVDSAVNDTLAIARIIKDLHLAANDVIWKRVAR
jgi:Mg2+/Co2+ transporter CorC